MKKLGLDFYAPLFLLVLQAKSIIETSNNAILTVSNILLLVIAVLCTMRGYEKCVEENNK